MKLFESIVVKEERSQGNYGYTWKAPPVVDPDNIFFVNYYDDYEHLLDQDSSFREKLDYIYAEGYGRRYTHAGCQKLSAKGLLVGTRVKLLDGSGEIVTAMYYDDKQRIIQRKSTNHLGGIDQEHIAYDYAGNPTGRMIIHTTETTAVPLQDVYTYSYDHAGRLLKTVFNGVTIEDNSYNELGQLINKKQSDVLDTYYTYNVRGWAKSIEEEKTGFKQALFYQQFPAGFQSGSFRHKASFNGNISVMSYQYRDTSPVICEYAYDGLNRLLYGEFKDSDGILCWEEAGYDKHGNIVRLARYDDLFSSKGWYNDLEITCQGNQLFNVYEEDSYFSNPGEAYGATLYPDMSKNRNAEFYYDNNGNLIADLDRDISTIRYNRLNLPDTIQFRNGNSIYYTYDAGGRKLKTKYCTVKPGLFFPITVPRGEIRQLDNEELLSVLTTDYVNNMVYENGERTRNLFKGGYINYGGGSLDYLYFNQDYLGNNRDVVRKEEGLLSVVQRTEYYPFGGPVFSRVGDAALQPYKYNGKEYDRMYGLNWYDFGARMYDPLLPKFTTMDPLAEKYYSISPYACVANNPVNRIDPDGRDIVVLHSPKSAGGFGHTAVLIGNDQDGWSYVSKNGTDWLPGIEGTSKSSIPDETFDTIEQFNQSGYGDKYCGYPNRVRFSTNKEQDEKALSAAKESAESWYSLLYNNCVDAVSNALSAAGLNPGYTIIRIENPFAGEKIVSDKTPIPNQRFEMMKRNNLNHIIPIDDLEEGARRDTWNDAIRYLNWALLKNPNIKVDIQ